MNTITMVPVKSAQKLERAANFEKKFGSFLLPAICATKNSFHRGAKHFHKAIAGCVQLAVQLKTRMCKDQLSMLRNPIK